MRGAHDGVRRSSFPFHAVMRRLEGIRKVASFAHTAHDLHPIAPVKTDHERHSEAASVPRGFPRGTHKHMLCGRVPRRRGL